MIFSKKAQAGQALLRKGMGPTQVSLDKMVAYPILHQVEIIDLSMKTLDLMLGKANAVLCQDYIKADIRMTVFIKVISNSENIQRVAQAFDLQQLNDKAYLEHYFLPQIESAIRIVASYFDFAQIFDERYKFLDNVLQVIGDDFSGFSLENMAIDYLEQTSLEFYNEDDFLEQIGKGKVNRHILEQDLRKTRFGLEGVQEVAKQEQEANIKRYQIELEIKKAEVKRRLEIAQLTAEQEMMQDQLPGKPTASEVDQKIEAIRAQAQQEEEKLEQLLKKKRAQDKDSK